MGDRKANWKDGRLTELTHCASTSGGAVVHIAGHPGLAGTKTTHDGLATTSQAAR